MLNKENLIWINFILYNFYSNIQELAPRLGEHNPFFLGGT